jgi:hypothetical protein
VCCRLSCIFLPLALLLASAPGVATCRQTVEALLAPHHRLAADGYDLATDDSRSPTVATCPRSHLSPDGGGVTRTPPPLGSGWLRFGNKIWCQAHDEHSALLLASVPGRSHLRQTVEALLAPHHRLAADGYDLATDDSRSPAVATCRQTVEALLAPHHRLAADGYDLATKFGARHMTNVSHFC